MSDNDMWQMKVGMVRCQIMRHVADEGRYGRWCQIMRHDGDVDRYIVDSGLHEYRFYSMRCL